VSSADTSCDTRQSRCSMLPVGRLWGGMDESLIAIQMTLGLSRLGSRAVLGCRDTILLFQSTDTVDVLCNPYT